MKHLIAVVVFAACGRPDGQHAASHDAPLSDARTTCVELMQRQRACTDDFIPALVDLRRELDVPTGISTMPRADVVAAALEEWKTDSADAAIASHCERLAPKLGSSAASEARRCVATGPCEDFVRCVIPLTRALLTR